MNSTPMPAARRALAVLAAPTLIAVFALAGAKAGDAAPRAAKPPKVDKPEAPAKADRNGNKLSDELEAKLAGKPADTTTSVIVTLAEPATNDRVDQLAKRVGKFTETHRFSVVHGFAAELTKGQAEALSHVPSVVRVEENSTVRAFDDGARSSYGVTKARADVPSLDGEADGNAATYSSGDLVAAVVDTGIDAAHLDLDEGKVIAFKDFVNGRTTAYDDNGHGTHVAATIAGEGDARADRLYQGVAPGAALVGVKVLDANGGGTMANVTAAIDWVVQNRAAYGIEAINLSLGASGCSDGLDATSQAVNNAVAAGLVVAVAAGNEGSGVCTIGTPGAATQALTVGAMSDLGSGGFSLAPFSSRGKTADGRIKPDIAAPGVEIMSAQANVASGYVSMSGTSMATPFTAGTALLLLDANRGLTPAGVRDAIRSTAVEWGPTGADIDYGAGRLDAFAALKAAGAPVGTPPAVPAHAFHQGSLAGTGAVADYKLDVASTAYPIAATLIMSSAASDFDLYLYNPAGQIVAWSERVERQEDVTFKPTATGTYTLRVHSYSGNGPFFVDVSAGLGTLAAPAPAPAPAPVTTVTSAPSSFTITAGSLKGGSAASLASDDDQNLLVGSTTSGTRVSDWYGRIAAVGNALKSLKVNVRSRSTASCEQRVFVYDWTYGVWTRIDNRTVGTSEIGISVPVGGTLANYVSGSSGDGEVAVRIRCARGDYVSFTSSADLMSITFER
ncbi:MAG: S8 family serine peptidase [Actinomycetota bacterium]|nr:S8 family serine peptidase [Actinomycetota bacterium]